MWYTYILQNVYHNKDNYTSFTSHNDHFVWVRTLKVCSFSNFQVHSTVNCSHHAVHHQVPRSIHLLTESLTTRSPCPPVPGSHHSILPASVSSPLLELLSVWLISLCSMSGHTHDWEPSSGSRCTSCVVLCCCEHHYVCLSWDLHEVSSSVGTVFFCQELEDPEPSLL